MKAGWEVKALGEVCSVEKNQLGTKELPYVGLEDLISNAGGFIGSREPQSVKSTTFVFGQDHVLYGRLRPYLNKVHLPDFEGHCSSEIFPFKPSPMLDKSFLFYWLITEPTVAKINKTSTGARMPRANISALMGFEIPLPPLDEQKRIVAVLDAAFEGLTRARTHVETNLQNARELFESSLRAIFSNGELDWPKKYLHEVCSDFGRGKSKHRPRNDLTLYGGNTPFLQTGDLTDANRFVERVSQRYSDKGLAQSKLWPAGTVCIAIVGATIGETGIARFDVCFPDSVIGMTPDPEKADSQFIEFLLQNYKADLKKAGEGSARDNINLGTFSEITFPIPTVEFQRCIVTTLVQTLEHSDEARSHYRAKLQDLDDLRQSLLQKAFAGELT